ncbi:HIT domain-containing protein [Lentisphaerota bacterium ZTH]|nr:HIT domain-containing protein [Lentisphaerota bacterium]WET07008.1 HIT domain-containing protein [Lentisphaerota bacterium ZTH]
MSSQRPLWAPWRIQFIKGEKEQRCFLCDKRVPDEESPEESIIIHRGKTCFVIMNRFPYNSGHLMVATYRHIGDISDISVEERHELMDLCIDAKNTLQNAMGPEAFNVGFNLGSAAGAGVADHLHMHIVPRWAGDTNFMPVISDTRCVPEAIEDTAELLRRHWQKM